MEGLNAGSAYITVKPDMRRFNSSVSSGMRSRLGGLAKMAAHVGGIVGAYFSIEFAKRSLEAFDELEKSTKRLTYSLEKISKGGAKKSTEELLNWAKDFSIATGINETQIVDMQSKLTGFGTAFLKAAGPHANKAIEDLTAGMLNLGSATGKSASMLLRSLGPSILNTPDKAVTLLQKYGVVTGKTADKIKNMVKHGKALQATQLEINALTGKYKGAAEATSTPLEKLSNLFNQLELIVGKELNKAFTYLFDIGTKVVRWMRGASPIATLLRQEFWYMWHTLEAVIGAIVDVIKFVAKLVGHFIKAHVKVQQLHHIFQVITTTIQKFVAWVKETVKRLVIWAKQFDRSHHVIRKLNTVVEHVIDNVKALGKMLIHAGERIVDWYKKMDKAHDITHNLGVAVGIAFDLISGLVKFLDRHAEVFKSVGIAIGILVAAMVAYNIVMGIADIVTGIFAGELLAIELPVIAVIALVIALVAALVYAYRNFKTFHDIVDTVFHAVVSVIKQAVKAIKNIVLSIFKVVKNVFNLVGDLVHGRWHKLWGDAKRLAKSMLVAFATYMTGGFLNSITGAMSKVWKVVTGKFGDIISFIAKLPHKISAAAVGMWDGIKDAFKSALNSVITWWNGLTLTLSIPGVSVFGHHFGGQSVGISTPDIPTFRAEGGPIRASEAYIVGERGPELLTGINGRIVPNNRLAGAGEGNAHLTITNWDEGTGYISREADRSAGAYSARDRQRARMGR